MTPIETLEDRLREIKRSIDLQVKVCDSCCGSNLALYFLDGLKELEELAESFEKTIEKLKEEKPILEAEFGSSDKMGMESYPSVLMKVVGEDLSEFDRTIGKIRLEEGRA